MAAPIGVRRTGKLIVVWVLASVSLFVTYKAVWDPGFLHQHPWRITAVAGVAIFFASAHWWILTQVREVQAWLTWLKIKTNDGFDLRIVVFGLVAFTVLGAALTWQVEPTSSVLGSLAQVNATLFIGVLIDRRYVVREQPSLLESHRARRVQTSVELAIIVFLGLGTAWSAAGMVLIDARVSMLSAQYASGEVGLALGLASAILAAVLLAERAAGRVLGLLRGAG